MVPITARTGYYSIGSGTVVTKRGHILTDNHIFVDDNGKPYNASGEILIVLPPSNNLTDKVQIRYRAEMVQADANNDLALIQIKMTRDNRALPSDLGVGVAPIGDSNAIKLGDPILVLGFPGVGGAYNAAYQLIGVPSQVSQARQTTGKLDLIRPIRFALPLIELAKRQAGE